MFLLQNIHFCILDTVYRRGVCAENENSKCPDPADCNSIYCIYNMFVYFSFRFRLLQVHPIEGNNSSLKTLACKLSLFAFLLLHEDDGRRVRMDHHPRFLHTTRTGKFNLRNFACLKLLTCLRFRKNCICNFGNFDCLTFNSIDRQFVHTNGV